jgi:hypothetical protein
VTKRSPVTVRLETHVPALQVWPVPQDVPFAAFTNGPEQVGPVVHDSVPVWQGFVGDVQVAPAVQEVHVPEPSQTWFVPHEVPAAAAVVLFAHVEVPVAQEVVPR